MRRISRFWKDETAGILLEYSLLIGLIIAAFMGTVFLVGRLAGGQWMAFSAVLR